MKKKIWINKADSFAAAEEFDDQYYRSHTAAQRLDEMQFLREQYFKMNKEAGNAHKKDYEELLRLFNKHNVKHCIVGAYAVAFYKKPRFTKDMDIF